MDNADTVSPSGYTKGAGSHLSYPAGSALSPDGKYLYVACNGDNSLAIINTATKTVVKQLPVGYFPYGVSVTANGQKVVVSNWGVMEYKFKYPTYDGTGKLAGLTAIAGNQPDGFYVPTASTPYTDGQSKSSSISVIAVPGGDATKAVVQGNVYEGQTLDDMDVIGDTHPCATAVVRRGLVEVTYVAKANNDSLGLVLAANSRRLPDFDLSLAPLNTGKHAVHGAYPNALAVSPDNTRLYVAEAGINSVAVLDVTNPTSPKLLGRIPTGWYPSALAVSGDGKTLFVTNAKGVGEDINTNVTPGVNTGVASFPSTGSNPVVPAPAPAFVNNGFSSGVDGNYIFGSAQKIDLTSINLVESSATVLANNFSVQNPSSLNSDVVPVGGTAGSSKIKHVIFILQENKTFDSMLGKVSAFRKWASTSYNDFYGAAYNTDQFNNVVPNMQALAQKFATGVNYYSNSEESDAGHQFAASGTATDYTEKTLLVKSGRGMLVNKNFEPEDYPEGGYIFNNAARHGVSFKDYGALVRIDGTDTGASVPTTLNDVTSGLAGYPMLASAVPPMIPNALQSPFTNQGDVDSPTQGLGQSYFLALPVLAVLGEKNPDTNEDRIDRNYPGYNFNISDQRRAKEFIKDFDRMVKSGTLPKFLYIYLPNDHTGGAQAPNTSGAGSILQNSPINQVADGDVALGMVVNHIMQSPIYYSDPSAGGDGTGAAIFHTFDDAQSTKDHIHPHRTPVIVVSPYARPGVATRHYVTASIVKTEELLLGLPANNLGDLFATDLRDMFQSTYNGIKASDITLTRKIDYVASAEGKQIWALARKLDLSSPDKDSRRRGAITMLTLDADKLHTEGAKAHTLGTTAYKAEQKKLFTAAQNVINSGKPTDTDGDGE